MLWLALGSFGKLWPTIGGLGFAYFGNALVLRVWFGFCEIKNIARPERFSSCRHLRAKNDAKIDKQKKANTGKKACQNHAEI